MAAPPLSSLPANTLAQQAHSPLRDTPAIIIHIGSLAYEQPPDGHGARFSLGQQQGTPIALSSRKQDFLGDIGVGRIQPVPLQEVVPSAPEPRPQPIPLQFRAGSKGPTLIHFLTKRCMFGQPFGRPDRPPARGPCAPARDTEQRNAAHKRRLSLAGYNAPEIASQQEVCSL